MKCLSHLAVELIVYSLVAVSLAIPGMAQANPQLPTTSDAASAVVRAIQVLPGPDGPALEILSNRPLVPVITKLDNPSRVAIDLPNARLSMTKKRIDFRSAEVNGIRVDLYQRTPPITRIVVDLAKDVRYSWDAAGSRLMVRLRPAAEDATAKPPSVPALTQGTPPPAVPLSRGSGAVVLAGSRVATGSSVTAGADTAVLGLGRGGHVNVCPGTTVSVTASQNRRSLMLGMSTGALEAHYHIDTSADSILTPDFRIQLPGPGDFHYAVSADSHGNTCIRALPGNTASLIVSELLGDGTYQVKPNEQIVFHSGRLSLVDSAIPAGCGCPAASTPEVMRAATTPLPEATLPSSTSLPSGAEPKAAPPSERGALSQAAGSPPSQVTLSVVGSETASLPPIKPNEVRVQVEAPFVFRADEMSAAQPAPTREAEALPVTRSLAPASFQVAALPPPQTKPQRRGVFGKIKGFFVTIFG